MQNSFFVEDDTDQRLKKVSYRNAKFGEISSAIGTTYKNNNFGFGFLTSPVLYIHLPNVHDYLLLYGIVSQQHSMQRYRLNNPFKYMETTSSVRPICKLWLCVSLSIFNDNSYARLYFLDWEDLNSRKD